MVLVLGLWVGTFDAAVAASDTGAPTGTTPTGTTPTGTTPPDTTPGDTALGGSAATFCTDCESAAGLAKDPGGTPCENGCSSGGAGALALAWLPVAALARRRVSRRR